LTGNKLTTDIEQVLRYYKEQLGSRLNKLLSPKDLSTPELLNEIFNDASASKASDIHIEPIDKMITVRFRIDGILKDIPELPEEICKSILNRIKVKSKLPIDKHQNALDGSFAQTM
jgi:type II secretory ATPase GspE/PulE/Tfp pilus assembly ATPase PilB-like protein